ncbi:hypothetical protein GCM10010232_30240 [Streptomyces amakusaensis]|uniref:Transposase n=1 Tax=Streptomyces amakusaensis TaxID=67271 RepID=A0ABW0ADJ0_9ACTN
MTSAGTELFQEITPGAQAQKHALEQERVRKNVRPAEEPPFHVDLDANLVRIRRPGREGRGHASHRGE